MPETIIGKNLSNFSFINQNGETVSIGNYSGKKIVLWWFPKADTPGWTLEGNGFRDRIQDFTEKNTIILGISGDSPEDNKNFKEKFCFPFDILSDIGLKETKKLNLCNVEDSYAPRVSVIMDEESNVIKYFDTVNPQSHASDLLATIDS